MTLAEWVSAFYTSITATRLMMLIKWTLHLSTMLLLTTTICICTASLFKWSSTVPIASICILFLLVATPWSCNNLVHVAVSDLTGYVERDRRCTRWDTPQGVYTIFIIFRIEMGYQWRVVAVTTLVAISNASYVLVCWPFKFLLLRISWSGYSCCGRYLLITV